MRAIFVIAEREVRSYFASPVGYVVLAAFLLITGLFFLTPFTRFGEGTLRPMIGNTLVFLTFLLPALTMRLLAEEKKTGTVEILMASPVTDTQVVVGKFFGVCAFYGVMLVATFQYPFMLSMAHGAGDLFPAYVGLVLLAGTLFTTTAAMVIPGGRALPLVALAFAIGLAVVTVIAFTRLPEPGPVLTGYLGLFLFGASFLAIGLLCSAATRNQVVAYVVTLVLLLGLLLVDWISGEFTAFPWLTAALRYMSLAQHLDNFSKGVIATKDVFLYVSMCAVALIMSIRIFATSRWK